MCSGKPTEEIVHMISKFQFDFCVEVKPRKKIVKEKIGYSINTVVHANIDRWWNRVGWGKSHGLRIPYDVEVKQ